MFRRILHIIRNLPLLVKWIKLGSTLPYEEQNVHQVSEVMIWITERSFNTTDKQLIDVIRTKLSYTGKLDIKTTTPTAMQKVKKISMMGPNDKGLIFTKIWVLESRM